MTRRKFHEPQKHSAPTDGREYPIWNRMRLRCADPTSNCAHNYIMRGITVCDRWVHGDGVSSGFDLFYADMGPRPSLRHSVERINNDLGYSPDNCRWATWEEQHNNRRNNRLVSAFGETLTLTNWSLRVGIPVHCIRMRLNRGWPVERALSEPLTSPQESGRRGSAVAGRGRPRADLSPEFQEQFAKFMQMVGR